MSPRRWTCSAILSALLACSSPHGGAYSTGASSDDDSGLPSGGDTSSAATQDGGSGAGSPGAGSSSGGAATGSASTGPGSGSADGGPGVVLGDASVPDSELGTPITLTMNSFTVAPNTEVYMCQQFGNPFGKDVDLVKMVGSMSVGSHHFFLFNMTPSTGRNTTAALEPCPDKGLEFHPFPYLSQQPQYTVQYGAGMGYPLVGQNGLMMNAHYLNASATAVTPKVTITIYPAKPGTVTTHVGTIFLNNQSIYVPAGTTQSSPLAVTNTDTPISDESYTIFTNWSHMHQYALDFQASTGGAVFYDEKQWSEPPSHQRRNGNESVAHAPDADDGRGVDQVDLHVLQPDVAADDVRRFGGDQRHVHLPGPVLSGRGNAVVESELSRRDREPDVAQPQERRRHRSASCARNGSRSTAARDRLRANPSRNRRGGRAGSSRPWGPR